MSYTRVFHAFFLAALAVMLAACSGSKPTSTVEAFFNAVAKGDVEKASEQISFAGVSANEMIQAKGKIQMIVGEMHKMVEANGGLAGIEVVESKIDDDGKSATVKIKLKFKNGKDQEETQKLVKEDAGWKISLKMF